MDLSKLSDKEIRDLATETEKELAKRKAQLLHDLKVQAQEENHRVLSLLIKHPEIIKAVCEHNLKSCSDDNRSGAYVDHGVPRCGRCYLLALVEEDWRCDLTTIEYNFRIKGFNFEPRDEIREIDDSPWD